METKYTQSDTEIIPTSLAPKSILERQQDTVIQQENIDHSEALKFAISHNRVNLFVQPIVTLPQRKTAFFEIFGRLCLSPGEYLPARDYLAFAKEEHLINRLDTKVLSQSLQFIRKQQSRGYGQGYFINIKPFTLRNGLFMNNLIRELQSNPSLAKLLIFEINQRDFLMLSPAEIKIIHALAQTGCRFSLDHVDDIPNSAHHLHAHYITYLKIKTSVFKSANRDDDNFQSLLKKKRLLEINGISMIAEHVENEKDVLHTLDFDIEYAQGYLFGRPDFQGVYSRNPQIPSTG